MYIGTYQFRGRYMIVFMILVVICLFVLLGIKVFLKFNSNYRENAIKEKFLKKLIKTYTNYDVSFVQSMLDDNVHFDSMWVLSDILGKKQYLMSLAEKLKAMKKKSTKTNFMLMYNQITGTPYLILTPRTPEGDFGCFSVDVNEKGLINAIHLTMASFYQPLTYKDKKKYDAFMNNINNT